MEGGDRGANGEWRTGTRGDAAVFPGLPGGRGRGELRSLGAEPRGFVPGGGGMPAGRKPERPGPEGGGEEGRRVLTSEKRKEADARWEKARGERRPRSGVVCVRPGAARRAEAPWARGGVQPRSLAINSLGDPVLAGWTSKESGPCSRARGRRSAGRGSGWSLEPPSGSTSSHLFRPAAPAAGSPSSARLPGRGPPAPRGADPAPFSWMRSTRTR